MKIAFLGPAYPLRGGIAQFIAIMAKKFGEKHEVKIFSFIKQYPKILFPGKEQIDKSELQIPLNIEAVLTPYNPFTFFPTIKKIQKWQPDLLIIKYWIPFFAPAFGVIIRMLKIFTNIKIMIIVDNIDFHEKWILGEFLTKFALGKSDYFVTMSDSVQKSTIKIFPNKTKNIIKLFHPNYDFYQTNETNSQIFKKKLNLENCPVILFFGYIKPYKGLDILLKSMPLILAKLPNLKLLIAGEIYGDDSIYKSIIKELNIGKHLVFFDNYIANEEVHNFFDVADVVVLPYKTATQSGITQLAFSMNTPVIASDVGGLGEVVIHAENGFLFENGNISQLSDYIYRFFNESKKEIFVDKIISEKDKFSWDSFIEKIENIL